MQSEHVLKVGNVSFRPASWVNLVKIPGHLYLGHFPWSLCICKQSTFKVKGATEKEIPKTYTQKYMRVGKKPFITKITKSCLMAFLNFSLCNAIRWVCHKRKRSQLHAFKSRFQQISSTEYFPALWQNFCKAGQGEQTNSTNISLAWPLRPTTQWRIIINGNKIVQERMRI